MRIALYHNLPSGGAKRAIYELIRHLQSQHQIDAYTLSSANHDFADLRPYVDGHFVYPFQPLPLLKSPFGRANQVSRLLDLRRIRKPLRAIARDIEARAYDVVFVQPCQVEIAPSILDLVSQIPTVYYCHEPLRRVYEPMPRRPYDNNYATHRALLDRIDPLPKLYLLSQQQNDRRNAQRANVVLVNSFFNQKNVQSIYQVRADVSYPGVDTEMFRPLDLQKRQIILSVGSLTPLKGFDFLIEAVGLLPKAKRLPLYLASNFQNPQEREYLISLALEKQVELHLLENISDDRLVELYNEAQVVAYAPIREPLGMVALEAMACAAPVIAVEEGGVQETVIHEETGLLTAREPASFAAALGRLLTDPQLASTFGHQARQQVMKDWSWDRAAAYLERALTTAASDTRQINAGKDLVTTSVR